MGGVGHGGGNHKDSCTEFGHHAIRRTNMQKYRRGAQAQPHLKALTQPAYPGSKAMWIAVEKSVHSRVPGSPLSRE